MGMQKLGRYQLETLLGSGAHADVYKAVDTLLDRTVALKVIKPALVASPEAMQRFFNEAKALANLQQEHIAWVWDLGEVEGRYFLSVRYVDGQSLDQVLKVRGVLPWAEALDITLGVASALAFAHKHNLVHRDVKPGNIIISKDKGAVLTDFGLVKVFDSSGITSMSDRPLGTLAYMAPEVLNGQPATTAADLFGLACVLVEMLTGKGPFNAPTPQAIVTKHFIPLQLPEVWPEGCRPELKSILEGALNPDPIKRLELGEFIDALSQPIATKKEPVQVVKSEVLLHTEKHLSKPIISSDNEMMIKLADGVEMVFVRVPAGVFWMGSDENDPDADRDEKPKHKVYIDEYWIGKYPVTNRQFEAFVKASRYRTQAEVDGYSWEWDDKKRDWKSVNGICWKKPQRNQTVSIKMDHPVVHVSWLDAQAFCQWASKVSGEIIHFPSEAQWEKAARGTDGRKYPWGNEEPSKLLLNYDNDIGETTEVGRYPAGVSTYGAHDMAGNVWEWMEDWYANDYYSISSTENPTGPIRGDFIVMRGGSWEDDKEFVRSSVRGWCYPDFKSLNLGLRCAMD